MNNVPLLRILKGVGLAVGVLFVIWALNAAYINVHAGQIVVTQDPIDGELHLYTEPGMKFTSWGQVTEYKRSFQYFFSKFADQGSYADQSIKLRFNDGGHGTISGSIRVDMPTDLGAMTDMHKKFGSQAAIEQQLVRTVFEKAVYMTGPLMSSKESYAERRNELITYIEDQAVNGVYDTDTIEKSVKDPISGESRTVSEVKIVQADGKPVRQEDSPLQLFKLHVYNLSINSIDYDEQVEKQIQTQQQAIMQVQTAQAKAKEAEQAAITAEQNGKAEAAKAKWEQEVIKAKAVVTAQQGFEVAELDKKAAEQTKQKEILLGQGEAERKRLVMTADGALEKKLETYERVNQMYAEAIKGYQGNWVPTIQMGEGSRGSNGAQDLIQLLTTKTARDLALDLSVAKGK